MATLSGQPDVAFTQSGEIPLAGEGGYNGVEVDDDYQNIASDTDSSVSSGQSTRTSSLSCSIFSFTYANGRRYHADRFKRAEYFMPNDEIEQDRLDFYHHIFLSLLGGKLYKAPLDKPQRVLDVGTGTGIWVLDFADEHPQAEIIGTDLSPIQPSWVPPNVKFEVEDMEEDWSYESDVFDYIHIRSLSGSFSNWDRVLEQGFHTLAPGGWIEYQDYSCQMYHPDGTPLIGISEDYPLSTYFHHVTAAAEAIGRPLIVAPGMKERMEKIGFVDVCALTAIWPAGDWPKDKRLKELGKWGRIGALESCFPFAVYLLTKQGWAIPEIMELCDKAVKDIWNHKYYTLGWFVYGRKPDPNYKKKEKEKENEATHTTIY